VFVGELSALVSAFIWACNGALLRWLSPRGDVIVVNALRCSVAAALMLLTLLVLGRAPDLLRTPPGALGLLLASVFFGMGLGDSFYFQALRLLGVVRAQPIAMSYPLISAVLAVLVLGEPLTVTAALGIVLVVAGVYAVAAAQAPASQTLQPLAPATLRAGVLFALAAAVCLALGTIFLRPASSQVDPWVAATVRLMGASGFLLVYTARRLPAVRGLARKDPAFGVGVLLLGLGTAVSMSLFVAGIFYAGAARGGALASTASLFGVPIAVFVLREPISRRLLAGALLSVVGVWLILLR
jgi:drug/metabolite transporter (DMT)-like permease